MARIYISGGITEVKDYMHHFEGAQNILESQGYDVINPAAVNALLPESTTYEEYMGMSETMLDMADEVYMLIGWEDSKGATWELQHAISEKKTIRFEGAGYGKVHKASSI